MSLAMSDMRPSPTASRLLADMVPPRHFAGARFDTYDPYDASGAAARDAMRALVRDAGAPRRRGRRGAGVYLDGGFGVGKTHLLAAAAHELGPAQAAFATFAEFTYLVGLLGFAGARSELATRAAVLIDEFELDDVGDTLIITRLIRELTDAGVFVAASSNTLPGALGEGRFAAGDFAREIGEMARRFTVYRIDGQDYRHRDPGAAAPAAMPAAADAFAQRPGVADDDFNGLLAHLATVHPGTYRDLVRDLAGAVLRDVRAVTDQFEALRFVVLVDRLYDEDVPIMATGLPLTGVFDDAMLAGGYRKKYGRAVSRLRELTTRTVG